MTKKSLKDAATAGTSVFDQIARGSVTDVKDVNNVSGVKNAKNVQKVQNANDVMDAADIIEVSNGAADTKLGRPTKYDGDLSRLNLKIPAEIREYMTILAAEASIAQRRQISVTQYLCDLVAAEWKKRNE